ncbi:hypothetical protein KEM56_001459 [Ascosphaera pollenicola]|nr:hypothetical protein KEM56_001459 [Ascosphaera pollenicola]
MDNSRRVLIFFFLVLFILNAPGPQTALNLSDKALDAQIKEQKRALEVLSNGTYTSFDPNHEHWLPVLGFTKDAGFAWGVLPLAKRKAREDLERVVNTTAEHERRQRTMLHKQQEQRKSTMAEASGSDAPMLPVYRNVTGTVRGDWVRWTEAEMVDRPHMNRTALAEAHDYFSTEFLGNFTSREGSVSFDIYDDNTPNINVSGTYIRGVRSAMKIDSKDPYGTIYRNEMQGVHVPETGEMIFTTTSEKFAGLIGLPHFTTSELVFDASKQLLNRSLSYAVTHLSEEDQLFFPWYKLPHPTDFPGGSMPACEYIVYLQHQPATINDRLARFEEIQAIEDELAYPTGAPIPSPPLMVLSATIYSPDCGFVLRSKASPEYTPQENLYLMGPKREQYKHHVERFLILLSGIYVLQAFFLQRQMKECSTPSTQSRASFYSIAMMSVGDGLSLCFALLVVSKDANSLVVCATAFAGFAGMAFLGLKFQMEIWLAHAPERHQAAQQERQHRRQVMNEVRERIAARETLARQQRGESGTRNDNTSAIEQARADGVLPAPVTSPPVIVPSDQDTTQSTEPSTTTTTAADTQPTPARDGAAMYYGFYFTLSCLFILTAWALLWPKPLAYGYGYIITFVYLSFWTPQIFRNALRNCRKALTWEYVVGESLTRLFIPVYLLTASGNIYYIESNSTVAMGYIIWVWVQAWILAGQDLIGPRFFVPKGWAPPAYNYHPILRDDSAEGSGSDIEAGDTLPLGYLRADEQEPSPTTRPSSSSSDTSANIRGKTGDSNKHLFDCAICMQVIEVPVVTKDTFAAAVGASTLFNRRQYRDA